jgi:hypothetical protein
VQHQKEEDTVEFFETSDFHLACLLRTRGFRLSEARPQGRRVVFCFEEREDRERLTLAFYNGELHVEPLAFLGTIKELKGLVHGLTRGERRGVAPP